MDNVFLFVYVLVLFITVWLPIYLFGRIWFALSPFLINYYRHEKKNWFNNWNTDRSIIVIVMCVASICLSIFWGKGILKAVAEMNIDFIEVIGYIMLQLFCFVFMELKMEHPFKPYSAYKSFNKKKYNERFIFKEENKLENTLDFHTNEIKKEIHSTNIALSEDIQHHKELSAETHQLVTKNNHLLKASDFPYEIRDTANLILADVMSEYFINKDSEQSLSDFLLRKRKTDKIYFTQIPKRGTGVQPIFNFFAHYTDLFERCKSGEFTQVHVIDLINEMVVAKNNNGGDIENPINTKNISKYLKK